MENVCPGAGGTGAAEGAVKSRLKIYYYMYSTVYYPNFFHPGGQKKGGEREEKVIWEIKIV